MKRILIWLSLPIWLPVLLLMRLFHIGDLTQEEIARRRQSYTIAFQLLKAQRAHAAAIESKKEQQV
jgi:hypothetical protein